MKDKIITSLLVISAVLVTFIIPFLHVRSAMMEPATIIRRASNENEHISINFNDVSDNSLSADIVVYEEYTSEEELIDAEIEKMNAEMSEIENIADKKQWFIAYKAIVEKYSNVFGTQQSIYDCFTEEEIDLLFRVVQSEVGDQYGFEEKSHVASVVFNRLDHEKFPDNISEILVPSQFSTIASGRYLNVEVSEDTILGCEYAFQIEDTANGCVFFERGDSTVHDNYATFSFRDGAGHKFYKL